VFSTTVISCRARHREKRQKKRKPGRSTFVAPSSTASSEDGDSADSETLEEELRRKEEEAKQLREQLQSQQASDSSATSISSSPSETQSAYTGDPHGRPVSGRSAREQLFSRSLPSSDWLADGGTFQQQSKEIDGVVKRRLAIGSALSFVVGYLALQPDTSPPPKRPPAYFAANLMQGKDALESAANALNEADFDRADQQLQAAKRYATSDVLEGASSSLVQAETAKKARQYAQAVREDLEAADFKEYFKIITIEASQNYYADFCSRSARDGVFKLSAMLDLFPEEQLEAARQQPAF